MVAKIRRVKREPTKLTQMGYWYTYKDFELYEFKKGVYQLYLIEDEEHGGFYHDFNGARDEAFAHFQQYRDPLMKTLKKIRLARATRLRSEL
jgi:hypothetical protein